MFCRSSKESSRKKAQETQEVLGERTDEGTHLARLRPDKREQALSSICRSDKQRWSSFTVAIFVPVWG
jgi:hypothetical protein